MKLWRRLAKKQVNPETGAVTRTGRRIKQMNQYFSNGRVGPTPFLIALFQNAGIQLMRPAPATEVLSTDEVAA